MNWDEYFIEMLEPISKKSKDPRTKVACIFVGKNNEILITGFNGFPIGVKDLPERYNDRNIKYKFVSHAERNAIAFAARNGVALDGSKIYLGWYPCSECTKSIIQAGVKECVIDGRKYSEAIKHWESWKEDIDISKTMLDEAGINIRIYGK